MIYIILFSCSGGGKSSGKYTVERNSQGILEPDETIVISDSDGFVTLEVPIEEDDTSILLTVVSDKYLSLEKVYDADGELVLDTIDWYTSDNALTDAFFADAQDMVFNWPIRDVDPVLTEGDWIFVFSTLTLGLVYTSYAQATVYSQFKKKQELNTGSIDVTISVTDVIESNSEVIAGVENAIECWQQMWNPLGIELNVTITSFASNGTLPVPESGSGIEVISKQGEDSDILILIGETFDNSDGTFGLAGSIPGTLLATDRAAVSISWLEHAGVDGVLSGDEERVFCETMAHETGHYLGLYHPVESSYDEWDALQDTVDCSNQEECEDALSNNLMFPNPICNSQGCVEQNSLTSAQESVLHLYTGVY
jgi:hypothetical protein